MINLNKQLSNKSLKWISMMSKNFYKRSLWFYKIFSVFSRKKSIIISFKLCFASKRLQGKIIELHNRNQCKNGLVLHYPKKVILKKGAQYHHTVLQSL